MCLGFFFFFSLKFENFPKTLENSIFCQIFSSKKFISALPSKVHRENPVGSLYRGLGGGWFPAKFDDRGSGSNQEISFRIPEDEEEEEEYSHFVCPEDSNRNYDSIVILQMMKFFFRKFFIIINFYFILWEFLTKFMNTVCVCVCVYWQGKRNEKKKQKKLV